MKLPMSREFGVYKIVNKVNGRVYVGSVAKFNGFWYRAKWHYNDLQRNRHPNIALQRAWNKYGAHNFKFVIIEVCCPEDCIKREQFWIDKLKAFGKGYNMLPTAGSRFGAKLSEETKQRIRIAKIGKSLSAETRVKMSLVRIGKAKSEETKVRLKASHWTRGPRAKEIAAKISAELQGHPNFQCCTPERIARWQEEKKRQD